VSVRSVVSEVLVNERALKTADYQQVRKLFH